MAPHDLPQELTHIAPPPGIREGGGIVEGAGPGGAGMDRIRIRGGNPLRGAIRISGA